MGKIDLITSITGQAGPLLAEHPLGEGYFTQGKKLQSSSATTARLDHLHRDPARRGSAVQPADMTVTTNVIRTVNEVSPTGAHKLTTPSHAQVSTETPEYTESDDALVTLRRLEALRVPGVKGQVEFCQLSTSTLYGKYQGTPRTEKTTLYWRSPNGVAKLYHRNNRNSLKPRRCAATTPLEPGFRKAYTWYAAIAAQSRDVEWMAP